MMLYRVFHPMSAFHENAPPSESVFIGIFRPLDFADNTCPSDVRFRDRFVPGEVRREEKGSVHEGI